METPSKQAEFTPSKETLIFMGNALGSQMRMTFDEDAKPLLENYARGWKGHDWMTKRIKAVANILPTESDVTLAAEWLKDSFNRITLVILAVEWLNEVPAPSEINLNLA
jgi:hypothetical protein